MPGNSPPVNIPFSQTGGATRMAGLTPACSITLNTDNSGGTPVDVLPLARAQLGYDQRDDNHDSELCFAAETAMEKYTELAPRDRRTIITTVSGQIAYNLPTDFMSIRRVQVPSQYGYYNDFLFLPMIDTPASTLFGYSDYSFRMPSERIIRQGILGELDHYAESFNGFYISGNPPQIYYLPQPTTNGLTSIVEYAAPHPNGSTDPLNPQWTTLPGGHWKYVLRLIKWAIADARADKLQSNVALSQFDGGLSQMTESWKLANRADRILGDVARALGTDVTVALRS